MSIPEPNKYSLEEIAERWSLSVNDLLDMEESGELEIQEEPYIEAFAESLSRIQMGVSARIQALGKKLSRALAREELERRNCRYVITNEYSGPNRPPIPVEAGHPFRLKAATHSGESGHP